ncbi:MAG: carboxylating nicotinate-nucleotide diphosphorylase [Candidatus Omnitrophica bacterium]|nr:carboxylating nicotinate-nucleotide diphosphorylase [Candidatus Omnitrophota bacterium]
MKLSKERIKKIAKAALEEDIGRGDVTSNVTVPKAANMKADITFNEKGVICGLPIVETAFSLLNTNIRFVPYAKDGDEVEATKVVALLEGPARSIMAGERTALNFLGHLSGVATMTSQFIKAIEGTEAKIVDTRKTIPLMRYLQKYAVTCGGGTNHRMGLWDQVLIKDNHIAVAGKKRKDAIKDLVNKARRSAQKNVKIEVEVANLDEFKAALEVCPDIIMLDNMSVEDVKEAVKARNVKAPCDKDNLFSGVMLEVSGGVTLENVRSYAECGVDWISIGRLTHSARALDLSLEVVL